MNDTYQVVEAPEHEQEHDLTGTELIAQAEINMQIATAKRFPRSIYKFEQRALEMVTQSQTVAQECVYSLPRDGKKIEGMSIRFAEIMQAAWGNCRSASRIVSEGKEFIVAQGVFHDLETNSLVSAEVQRRIVGRNGQRYSLDMIGVTANAACSVALRNAILRGIPKGLTAKMYHAARKTIMGEMATFKDRRDKALAEFEGIGIKREQVFAILGIEGISDLRIEHMIDLSGMLTAIRDGELSIRDLLSLADPNIKVPAEPPSPQPSDLRAPTVQREPETEGAPSAPREPSEERAPRQLRTQPNEQRAPASARDDDELGLSAPAPQSSPKQAPSDQGDPLELRAPTTTREQDKPPPKRVPAEVRDAEPPAADYPDLPDNLRRAQPEGEPDENGGDIDEHIANPQKYLQSVEDELAACATEADLNEINQRLKEEFLPFVPDSIERMTLDLLERHYLRVASAQQK